MNDFASLMILSYNRRAYLERSLTSLWETIDYPAQIIILDDASNTETQEYLFQLVREKKVSTVLFNTGWNLGIGVAVNRGVAIARGRFIFKVDADILYTQGWLSESVRLLMENPMIGGLGLFRYHHPPCRHQDEFIKTHEGGFDEVKDFVGSVIGFRREVYNKVGPWSEDGHSFGEDLHWKTRARAAGFIMALPKNDLVRNIGFGETKSSLFRKIDWKEHKHEYNIPRAEPILFGPGVAQEPTQNRQCEDLADPRGL